MKVEKLAAAAVEFWRKKNGMTQATLSEKTGLAQNYISQIETGEKTAPSLKAIQKFAEVFCVSVPDFLSCNDKPDIEFIPLVKARPMAGNGGLETDGDFLRYYAFHSRFLARKGNAKNMCMFRIEGDSMEDTLRGGDLVMINQGDTHVRPGNVYLLRSDDFLMIKRLEPQPGGVLLVRSDNAAYKPFEITLADVTPESFQIYGRMVWSCREY